MYFIAPVLVPDDPRVERYFKALESSFDVHIDFFAQGFKWTRIADREQRVGEWILTTRGNRLPDTFGTGTNGKNQFIVSLMNILHGESRLSPRASEYRVAVSDRSSYPEAFPNALATVAVAVDAYYATADSRVCRKQIGRTPEDLARTPEFANIPGYRTYPLRRVPLFYRNSAGELVSMMNLSWLNYWSDAIAHDLKSPDPDKDRMLEGCYERIGDRGWLVRLTKEPLDLENPRHLERVQWAFDRFGQSSSA